jgi:hypothetical protein
MRPRRGALSSVRFSHVLLNGPQGLSLTSAGSTTRRRTAAQSAGDPVLVQGRVPSVLSDYCREKCGVVLGRGIGDLQGRAFRIAHMGHVNATMMFGVLGAIEMALAALGIPHGRGGVQAAVEYLGREVRP